MSTTNAHTSHKNPIDALFSEAAEQLVSTMEVWQPSSPRRLVADFDFCQLYVYPSLISAGSDRLDPADVIFIVYAMVNTASILDLQTKVSTIERLQQEGVTVYLMEWSPPKRANSKIGLYDYLDQSLSMCFQEALDDCGLDQLNLMGVCQGGVFSLCYAAMFPERVRSLIPVVTPVNFHTPNDTLSRWVRYLDLDALVNVGVNIPGQILAQTFLMLKPLSLTVQKYIDITENLNAETSNKQCLKGFMAMEQWIENTPDQPAGVFKEFISKFYQQNALYDATLELGGQKIDLTQLDMPILNIYALNDHLVPPESSQALGEMVPEKNYQSLEVPTGHIGIFVSQKSLNHVPKAIADYIRKL